MPRRPFALTLLLIFGAAAPAAALVPDSSGLVTQGWLRPPQHLALTGHRQGVVAGQGQEADGSMTFLGVQPLQRPRFRTKSVDSDTATIIHFFRQSTGSTALELLALSHSEHEGRNLYGFAQAVGGVPVLGTFAFAAVRDDTVRYARNYLVVPPQLNTLPGVSADHASGKAHADIVSFARNAREVEAPTLAIMFIEDKPTLVYQVGVDSEAPWSYWTVYVDAQSGAVLSRSKTSFDSVGGTVTGNIEPSCQGERPKTVALPYVQWSRGLATGVEGNFFSDRSINRAEVSLNGAFFRVQSYPGDNAYATVPLQLGNADNELYFDRAPLSQTDPFYYASEARLWVRARARTLPQLAQSRIWSWTGSQMPIKVNYPSGAMGFSCNAFYDGRSLNFYQPDARMGCNNSGRSANIVYHEYGHGIHDHLTANQYTFDHQVSEGVADYVMATMTNQPNVTGLMGCNAILTGRNTKRTCVNHYSFCRNRQRCHSFPGDEPHNSAPIMCGALWELRTAFKAKYGDSAGTLAADQFFLKFLTMVTDMNSAYSAAIAADDDADNDPRNGTDHSCEINQAFLGAGGNSFTHFPDLVRQRVPCVPRA